MKSLFVTCSVERKTLSFYCEITTVEFPWKAYKYLIDVEETPDYIGLVVAVSHYTVHLLMEEISNCVCSTADYPLLSLLDGDACENSGDPRREN